VEISHAFARRIIANNMIVRATARIKYLADAPKVKPILLEDVEVWETAASRGLHVGVILGAVGIVGAPLMFWFGRRRRTPAAAAPA